jgi:hypothetical protein
MEDVSGLDRYLLSLRRPLAYLRITATQFSHGQIEPARQVLEELGRSCRLFRSSTFCLDLTCPGLIPRMPDRKIVEVWPD